MQEKSNTFSQVDNQLIHTRLLNAPRELVWEVWTNPEHVKQWWGPDGFSLTHKSMQMKPGGEWNFVLHGYGKDFDNKVQFLEVVKPSLLSYTLGDGIDEATSFTVRVTFEDLGNKTFLTMTSIFKSAEVIAELNRQGRIIEGSKQTLNRLENFLKEQLNK